MTTQSAIGDIPKEARALEAADLSFILCEANGTLRYLSARARALLAIPDGCLETPAVNSFLSTLPLSAEGSFAQEHHLVSHVGHIIPTKIHLSSITADLKLIIIYPLSDSLPLLEQVERNQKLRPLLIMMASSLRVQDDLIRASHRVLDVTVHSLSELFLAEDSPEVPAPDLQLVLSRAVAIADIFLPSTIKLSVTARRHALLSCSLISTTRLVTHILFEAAAFTEGCGEIRLRSVVGLGKHKESTPSAEVVIIAERTNQVDYSNGNWLHETLRRRTQTHSRRVRVNDDDPMVTELQSGEQLIPPTNRNGQSLKALAATAVPEGGESIDLFLARKLATANDITLQITSPDSDVLAFYLSLPLSTDTIIKPIR